MTLSRDRRTLYEGMEERARMVLDNALEGMLAGLAARLPAATDDRAEVLAGAVARFIHDSAAPEQRRALFPGVYTSDDVTGPSETRSKYERTWVYEREERHHSVVEVAWFGEDRWSVVLVTDSVPGIRLAGPFATREEAEEARGKVDLRDHLQRARTEGE